jgi:hypothetical protein
MDQVRGTLLTWRCPCWVWGRPSCWARMRSPRRPGEWDRCAGQAPGRWVLDQRAGTLTREMIEQIASDPDTLCRRLVIDPDSGLVIDAGATTYHPGRHLALIVRRRDWGAASRAEAPRPGSASDHPYPVGGAVLANLACLCRRQHRLKTHGHRSLSMTAVGVCT